MTFEDFDEVFVLMQIPTFKQRDMRVFVSVHFFLRIILDSHHTQTFPCYYFTLE